MSDLGYGTKKSIDGEIVSIVLIDNRRVSAVLRNDN